MDGITHWRMVGTFNLPSNTTFAHIRGAADYTGCCPQIDVYPQAYCSVWAYPGPVYDYFKLALIATADSSVNHVAFDYTENNLSTGKLRIGENTVYTDKPYGIGTSMTGSMYLEYETTKELSITADACFSPNGDNSKEFNSVTIESNDDSHNWSLSVDGQTIRTGIGNYSFLWDGTANGRTLPDGLYTITAKLGETEASVNVVIDTKAPRIQEFKLSENQTGDGFVLSASVDDSAHNIKANDLELDAMHLSVNGGQIRLGEATYNKDTLQYKLELNLTDILALNIKSREIDEVVLHAEDRAGNKSESRLTFDNNIRVTSRIEDANHSDDEKKISYQISSLLPEDPRVILKPLRNKPVVFNYWTSHVKSGAFIGVVVLNSSKNPVFWKFQKVGSFEKRSISWSGREMTRKYAPVPAGEYTCVYGGSCGLTIDPGMLEGRIKKVLVDNTVSYRCLENNSQKVIHILWGSDINRAFQNYHNWDRVVADPSMPNINRPDAVWRIRALPTYNSYVLPRVMKTVAFENIVDEIYYTQQDQISVVYRSSQQDKNGQPITVRVEMRRMWDQADNISEQITDAQVL